MIVSHATEPVPDLSVDVVTSTPELVAAEPILLTIRLTNRGTAPATSVSLTNRFDSSTIVLSWPDARADRLLTWPRLEPGETKTVVATIIPQYPAFSFQATAGIQPGETVLFNNGFSLLLDVIAAETQPPAVEITAPQLTSSGLRLGDVLQLSANASDPDGELRRVRFYLGDRLVRDFASPPFTTLGTLTSFGTVKFSVIAEDNLGGRTVATMDLPVRGPALGEAILTQVSYHALELTAGAEVGKDCHFLTSTDLKIWELKEIKSSSSNTVTFTVEPPRTGWLFYKVVHPKPPEGGH